MLLAAAHPTWHLVAPAVLSVAVFAGIKLSESPTFRADRGAVLRQGAVAIVAVLALGVGVAHVALGHARFASAAAGFATFCHIAHAPAAAAAPRGASLVQRQGSPVASSK